MPPLTYRRRDVIDAAVNRAIEAHQPSPSPLPTRRLRDCPVCGVPTTGQWCSEQCWVADEYRAEARARAEEEADAQRFDLRGRQ